MNIDLGILTETKFTTNHYTKAAEGYTVVGTTAKANQGGVALIYKQEQDGGWKALKPSARMPLGPPWYQGRNAGTS